jgi:hypothetical protein
MKNFALGSILFLAACGGSSDNGLSESFPPDLAVTSPFANENVVEGLLKFGTRTQDANEDYVAPVPYEQKKEEISDRILGDGADACGFHIKLFRNALPATCYGPPIDFTAHPDAGLCADSDDGNLPQGDVGIWTEMEPKQDYADVTIPAQPCVVAKVNSLVSVVQGEVDMAIDLSSSLLCAAKVKGKDQLPAEGEIKALSAVLQEVLDDAAIPADISLATLKRETDTEDGFPVYLTKIDAVLGDPDDKQAGISLNMRHVPTSPDNRTYKGKLWYTITGIDQVTGPCDTNMHEFAVSLLYSKNASGKLKYRLQRATYCQGEAEPFDADFNIDADNKYKLIPEDNTPNLKGWIANYNEGIFEIDTETGSGKISYAWQAGSPDTNTRVFVAELDADTDGSKSGCGYFGFGPSAGSANVGSVNGMICNWAGPCNDHTTQDFVQRQCVTYDPETKQFSSDSDLLNIEYAPMISCDYDGSGSFVYDGHTGAGSNELLQISTMEQDITPPTKPDELF